MILAYTAVADPDLQIRMGGGGGHSNSEIRGGGVKKIFFSVLSKNKGWVGGGLGPSGSFPESATAL